MACAETQQEQAMRLWREAQPKRPVYFGPPVPFWLQPNVAHSTSAFTCPKCYGTDDLIFAPSHRRAVNCGHCLKKQNPQAWAERYRKEREATELHIGRVMDEIKRLRERDTMKRGFSYWIPPRPMALAGGRCPPGFTQDQWYTYNLACRQKAKV
jgi:hypothetical protein